MKTPEEILFNNLKEKVGDATMTFEQFKEWIADENDYSALMVNSSLAAMEEYADQFRNPPKKTIEERFHKFHDECNYFVGEYTHEMVVEFVDYWTEHGPRDRKMRFEKEPSFDLKKRLERWKRNQKPNYGKSEPVDRDKQLADYINRPR